MTVILKSWLNSRLGTTIVVNNPHSPFHDEQGTIIGYDEGAACFLVDFGTEVKMLGISICQTPPEPVEIDR